MKLKKLFAAQDDINGLKNHYFYFDNDILGIMYRNDEIFQDILECLKGPFIVDSFTAFEFMRDVFLPKNRLDQEKFLFNDVIFLPADDHQEIYKNLKDNALILSRIYSHKEKSGASLVDLLLAARLMTGTEKTVLVTGNKKDFPSFIFDIRCIFNYEANDGSVRTISAVQFNKKKFESCYRDLVEMEEKFKKA